MNPNHRLRVRFAFLQLALVCAMLADDCIFIHKHRTAEGVIIHTHPYDLSTNPGDTRHHQTTNEIFLLDIVFHGTYLQPSFIAIWFTLVLVAEIVWFIVLVDPIVRDVNGLSDLRAPPSLAHYPS